MAKRLDLTTAAVSLWRHNGIPSRYWSELARAAGENGRSDVTLETIRNADARARG